MAYAQDITQAITYSTIEAVKAAVHVMAGAGAETGARDRKKAASM